MGLNLPTDTNVVFTKKVQLIKSLLAREASLVTGFRLVPVEEWSVLFTNSLVKVRKTAMRSRRKRFRARFRRKKRRNRKRRRRSAYNFARAKWSFAARQSTGHSRKLNRKRTFLKKTLGHQRATTSANFKRLLLFKKRALRFRRGRVRKLIKKIKKVRFVRPRRKFRKFLMSKRIKRVRGVKFVFKRRKIRILRNRFWRYRYNFRRKKKGSYTAQSKQLFRRFVRQKAHPVLKFARTKRFLSSSVPFFAFPRKKFRKRRR